MSDYSRLVALLQSYGSYEEGRSYAEGRPFCLDGVWRIPVDGERVLVVPEADLPPLVAPMLEMLVDATEPQREDAAQQREQVQRWLAGERELRQDELQALLQEMGFANRLLVIVTVELANEAEEVAVDDAVSLLAELLEGEEAILAKKDRSRLYMLLSIGDAHAQEAWDKPGNPLSAWLDTIGAELYVLYRAGVSSIVQHAGRLTEAREEAEFALEAGKRYRSQERIHRFETLGLARLLHGVPPQVKGQFVQEVLPNHVLDSLSADLRETIFAFLEHGQQVADTARSLYIHRNTLLYRLERISELTGYDIRKPLQGWTLWLALRLSRSL